MQAAGTKAKAKGCDVQPVQAVVKMLHVALKGSQRQRERQKIQNCYGTVLHTGGCGAVWRNVLPC